MGGTWQELPPNCTRDIELAYVRCARWASWVRDWCLETGLTIIQTCAQWADDGYNSCGHYSDHGREECCDWAPCSWFCDAYYWVAKWVCDFFVWVVKWVCIAFVSFLVLFMSCVCVRRRDLLFVLGLGCGLDLRFEGVWRHRAATH